MTPYDLPERWQAKVREYLKSVNSEYENLGASDFPTDKVAKLRFHDGSSAEFMYPLVLDAPELNEVAVFTEHCGYHIFSRYGVDIKLEPRN